MVSLPFRIVSSLHVQVARHVLVHESVDHLGLLDLAHCWASASDATAHVDVASAAHEGEDERCDESGPSEPEEGG